MGNYWNRTGPAQAKYEEMEAAGWEFNETTRETFYRYYRYHNDGDAPARIRFLKNLGCSQEHPEIKRHESRLEERVTERVEIEYRRFQRSKQLSNREGGI